MLQKLINDLNTKNYTMEVIEYEESRYYIINYYDGDYLVATTHYFDGKACAAECNGELINT